MKISTNGKRNITLDFNAPKKFRLVKDGAEIPYIRTGKNSFRLSKPVEGFVELEEIVEQPRYMQPVQLQPQQMTVINPQDVDRLNEAIRQMSLVNPQDVIIINQTAEQLEQNQNFIAQTQKEITDNQVYIDQQQQRLNETALGIQALETDNSQRLDGAENAILNLAGEISNAQNMAVDGMNTALNKIEEQGILLQAEIDKKADKDELESLKKDFEEKSDRISSAMSNYSGGTAYDTLPQGGEAGQILAKRTDRQGDYIWIDQTPVIVKSKTIPTASEKYKGEVYQYVGETGDYTHGYIYECQEIENNFVWVRLDVQPNTAVWGQITGTLSDQTDLQEAFDDKQDKLTQTQMDAVNSGANQSNIAQISTNQTNINTINSKIPAQASSSNQLADKDWVENKGYITGITSGDVTTALGYTPYNSSNPDGYQTASDVATAISGKQDTLVSGTNIKTINNNSILGSGNLDINGLPTQTGQSGKFLTTDGTDASWADVDALPSQTGQSGKYLTTDGSSASWDDIPSDTTKANTSLSNLSSTGKNISNWSNNVSNCITEIPQDIKLEFANGTLTLKAGSKLYDGLGNSYTVPNDMGFSSASGASPKQIMLVKTDFSTAIFAANYDTNLSYNSSTGLVDYTGLGSYYLPVAVTIHSGATYTSIEQVFNGFGYVGNMIFSLPNIKGLIPNGRNADGSLKNIEFATSSVITRTYTTQSAEGILTLNCINDTYLSVRPNLSYDEASNQFINASSPNEAAVGVAKLDSGKVTYLVPKTSFHAVDYNDLKSLPNYNPTTTQTLKHVNGVLQWG